MTLRIVLVALVAALGLPLPGAEEMEAWERSGRAWVADHLADFSSLGVEVGGADEPADRPAGAGLLADRAVSSRADLAFEAAVEAMASGFSADLASMESKPTTVQDARLEKISEAVRLTRRAVDAWASVIQPDGDSL